MPYSEVLFDLQFSAKQLGRQANKAESASLAEKKKIKKVQNDVSTHSFMKALEDKNPEAARIYAENAIRKHNESINYLRLQARVDAVQGKVRSQMAMKDVKA